MTAPRKETLAEGIVLHLGDCRTVFSSLGKVDAVVTDPPYGIGADLAASKNKGKWGWTDFGETNWDASRPPDDTIKFLLALKVPTIIWGGGNTLSTYSSQQPSGSFGTSANLSFRWLMPS